VALILLDPNRNYALTLKDGTTVAHIRPRKLVAERNVIASMNLETESQSNSSAVDLLKQLDEASFDLALAVMAAMEEQLGEVGLQLIIDANVLTLGKDFSGLVVTNALNQISFKVAEHHTVALPGY